MALELSLTAETTGETRRLGTGTMGLGRAPDNNWALPDDAPEPTLSRRHCRVAGTAQGWTVTDLGSTNGTRLNGRVVQPNTPTPLQQGDVLEIGPHRLVVTIEEDIDSRRLASVPAVPPSLLGDDPFGLGQGPSPRAGLVERPSAPPPGSGSLDALFGDWGTADSGSSPPFRGSAEPPPLTEDPLAKLFKDDLDPLPRSRPMEDPPATDDPGGLPQFEALIPRARPQMDLGSDRPRGATQHRRGGAADPFGLATEDPPPEGRPANEPIAQHGPPSDPVDAARGADDAASDPFGLLERLQEDQPRRVEPQRADPPPRRPDDDDLPPRRRGDSDQTPPPHEPHARGRASSGPVQQSELLEAFLEGAGFGQEAIEAEDPVAFMREAGRSFARMAEGLRELLAVRATVKDHARLDRTQIGAARNNPLKFSISAREATAALLRRREEGYLAPVAAIDASFRDLKAHELALFDGLQSAVAELLQGFDPAMLERRLADAGAVALILQGGRRAKLWELYTDRYEEIAKHAQARFMGHFDGAFRSAYQKKTAEVSALDDRAAADPPAGTPSSAGGRA